MLWNGCGSEETMFTVEITMLLKLSPKLQELN